MDCIEWALWEAGDTFFVDADIVFLKPVDEEIDHSMDLMLSPHFHVEDKVNQNRTYGSFNVGYLWTKSMDFPQAWREIYTTRLHFMSRKEWFISSSSLIQRHLERITILVFGDTQEYGIEGDYR